MKKTSFRLVGTKEKLADFLKKHLPTYEENNLVEVVEENGTYTIYVEYDDTDIMIKELEECFMHVFLYNDYLDAWNMIHDNTEK